MSKHPHAVRWHKVKNGVAQERDIVAEDGVNVTCIFARGLRTYGDWKKFNLKPESRFRTLDAYTAHLRERGFAPGPAPARTVCPSLRTMHRYALDGVAKATDGCRVEPDGTCSHGKASWLLLAGVI